MAEEPGFENFIGVSRSVRGWILAESGQSAKGISELEANAPGRAAERVSGRGPSRSRLSVAPAPRPGAFL